MKTFVTACVAILAVASPAAAQKKDKIEPATIAAFVPDPVPTPDNLWHIQLSTGGTVVIQLRPDKAPAHVARIKTLTRAGFYDGLVFHRVIEGFMAQTGDPKATGEGGSPLPDIKAEFNDLPHVRGTASMARATDPNSANSQFFIVFMPTLRLDKSYTAFGRVVSGMNFVDAIKRGDGQEGAVAVDPSKMVKAWIEADGPDAPRVALPVASSTATPAAAPVAEAIDTPVAVIPAPPPAAAPVKKRKKVLGIF